MAAKCRPTCWTSSRLRFRGDQRRPGSSEGLIFRSVGLASKRCLSQVESCSFVEVCVINRILAGLRRVTSSGMYDARIDGLRALAILPVVLFHDALRGRRVLA